VHIRSLIILGVLVFGLAGCQAWEKTKSIYRGTIFPAQVDVQADADVDRDVVYLARLVSPVDAQLEALVRSTQRIGNPSDRELQTMFSSYAWLNGIAAYSASGQLMHRVPNQPVKEITLKEVLDESPQPENGPELFVQVVEQDLGPEVCLVKPVDNAGQVDAYVLVHFDPRSLFSRSPIPEDLLVMHRGKVLWSGMQPDLRQTLMDRDWEGLLQSGVQGELVVHKSDFFWLSRYVGPDPLVYVVRTTGSK
jgi:hypothetical protein